jgi:hypothetical protein
MGTDLSYHNDFGESYLPYYYGQMPLSYDVFGNPIYYRCYSEAFKTSKDLENLEKTFVQ